MKYLPTPLNVIAGLIILFSVYSFIKDRSLGHGDGLVNFWTIALIGLAIAFLLVDFALLRYIKKYKTVFLIEVVIIIACYLIKNYILRN